MWPFRPTRKTDDIVRVATEVINIQLRGFVAIAAEMGFRDQLHQILIAAFGLGKQHQPAGFRRFETAAVLLDRVTNGQRTANDRLHPGPGQG